MTEEHDAGYEKVTLGSGNPNTQTEGVFCKAFEPARARRLARRIELRCTPKRGSWLNIAERKLGAPTQQCPRGRRIGKLGTLRAEDTAWPTDANRRQPAVDWDMTSDQRSPQAQVRLLEKHSMTDHLAHRMPLACRGGSVRDRWPGYWLENGAVESKQTTTPTTTRARTASIHVSAHGRTLEGRPVSLSLEVDDGCPKERCWLGWRSGPIRSWTGSDSATLGGPRARAGTHSAPAPLARDQAAP